MGRDFEIFGRGRAIGRRSDLLRVQACPPCRPPSTRPTAGPDPRRWFAAAVVIVSVAIPVLDNTMLNVAIPTILREFHTDLPSLQWVITGYSLTFATLLIIGGRLGDMYGHRRMFMIGAAIFGVGSLLASVSHSVPTLVLGEAIIEGIGASLMIPATLSILSTTFAGRGARDRVRGVGNRGGRVGRVRSARRRLPHDEVLVALGVADQRDLRAAVRDRRAAVHATRRTPRAPAAHRRPRRGDDRDRFVRARVRVERGRDLRHVPAAARLLGQRPARCGRRRRPVSIAPVAIVAALVILSGFFVFERAKERRNARSAVRVQPARAPGFRYGLQTTMVLAMGQFGFLLVVPVLLQDGQHFTALRTGAYMVPMGVCIALGAPLGGRCTRMIGTTRVVRIGLVFEAVGLVVVALMISHAHDVARAAPRLGAVRRRRGLRELAAHQRDPLRRRPGEGRRRERHQHDRSPGRRRARHRGDRFAAQRADDHARGATRCARRCCSRAGLQGVDDRGDPRQGRELRAAAGYAARAGGRARARAARARS